MAIRTATTADFDALLPVFLDLRRFSRQGHPPLGDRFEAVLAASTGYLREILNRQEDGATLLALDDDDRIAGYLVATIHEPNPLTSSGAVRVGSIDELYVDQQYRGSGAGGRLMKAAETWFGQLDVERLEVGAYAWNSEAIAFYESHGFAAWAITLSKPLERSAE